VAGGAETPVAGTVTLAASSTRGCDE